MADCGERLEAQDIAAREKAETPGWEWQTDKETKAIIIFRNGSDWGGDVVLIDGECLMDRDADLIVRAVNWHGALLAKLREAQEKLEAVAEWNMVMGIGAVDHILKGGK